MSVAGTSASAHARAASQLCCPGAVGQARSATPVQIGSRTQLRPVAVLQRREYRRSSLQTAASKVPSMFRELSTPLQYPFRLLSFPCSTKIHGAASIARDRGIFSRRPKQSPQQRQCLMQGERQCIAVSFKQPSRSAQLECVRLLDRSNPHSYGQAAACFHVCMPVAQGGSRGRGEIADRGDIR